MAKQRIVYAAFNSNPDFTSGTGALISIHDSLDGAIKALYPNNPQYWDQFRKSSYPTIPQWIGPDGFGRVEERELKP